MSDERVARFPPDPRQRTRNRIVGAISSQLSEGEMQLAADTGVTGYPASSVNVGRIKDALEEALQRLGMAILQARWETDVRGFVLSILHAWLQRAKHMKASFVTRASPSRSRRRTITDTITTASTYFQAGLNGP
jgi:hypothetical protein